ncbi:hypothetical protein [Phreatobacter stygius]|uniref:DUF1311 domain-containing protein n=1 Tax=Phreatobacter stygius TaxID=1940610 RepID=A0A4D7B3K0_9HYPH|nr:hypothetical protein [Phreatobacter stygius]QCI65835.1 hypothetical protein E8M01_17420 [Phreatobacter stygius]
MISRVIFGLAAGLLVFSNVNARAADDVGVPECDRFITSYETCVTTRAPAAQRPVLTQQIAQMRSQWKALAANPQTRAQLQQACTMQAEQMKQAMAPMGCTF